LFFQEEAQVRAVTVNGVGHDPADGQVGGMGSLHHPLGQFGFGLEGDRLRDMGGLPASRILAPVFGQIQFAVDEGVTQGGDVREKDAHLAIFDAPSDSAILPLDTCGVGAAFGEATLVKDEDGEEGLGFSTGCLWLRQDGRRLQGLADQRSQLIANAGFVPDRLGEQALDTIGAQLSGLFGDLPAIFAWDVTDDGLQVEQSMTAWFGASKIRTQTLMDVLQAH